MLKLLKPDPPPDRLALKIPALRRSNLIVHNYKSSGVDIINLSGPVNHDCWFKLAHFESETEF